MSVFAPLYSLIFHNSLSNCIDSPTLDETKAASLHQTKKPPMYKVIMLNDDFTPMDFVVYILEAIFQKNNDDAMQIMLDIHHNGSANCGLYTYEIAEMKQTQVIQFARQNQYPLQCILEKE